MAQVVVAAFLKRNLPLPDDPSKLYHGDAKQLELLGAGSADDLDENDDGQLKKPSSDVHDDEEEGDHGSSAKREQSVTNDANLTTNNNNNDKKSSVIQEGESAAAVAVAPAPPENFDAEVDHEGNLKMDKDADLFEVKKKKNAADNKPSDADYLDNNNHNAEKKKKTANYAPAGKETDENFKVWDSLAVGPDPQEEDEEKVIVLRHSEQFRFLDKAAIPVDQDWSNGKGKEGQKIPERNPWTLCTTQQVEELKCIVRLIPMWATVIPTVISLSMGSTYAILAAQTMDRRVGKFVVPAASLGTISTITVLIWLPLYDKVVTPFLRRYTGKERGITFLQKITVGFFLLIIAELLRTVVEHERRETAARNGLTRPFDALPFSALWLVPQFIILGLSESFMMVGQVEFFYLMLPEHMTSTGSAFLNITIAAGTGLSSVSLSIIKRFGWLENNINTDHLDYLYTFVTVVIALDFVLYLLVARWYTRQRHLSQMMLQL